MDRLAAAPRKTLNRNPAGKIACSQLSQGVQSGLAYGSNTFLPCAADLANIERPCPQKIGRDGSRRAKLQAENLESRPRGASSETFDYQTRSDCERATAIGGS